MAEPTEQSVTNIPSWLRDPILKLVGQAEALSQMGYQPYVETDAEGKPIIGPDGKPVMRQRVAGFNPLQAQAFQNIAGMQTADQIRQATGMAGLAGIDAGRLAQYTPATERNFYDSPAFREMQTGFERVQAAPTTQYQMGPVERVRGYEYAPLVMDPAERVRAQRLREYRMGPAERVQAERFGLGSAQEYMSPYMQSVVERQKQAATRDYLRGLPALGAAAARVGGRGGTRETLLQAEAQRNLAERMGDIEATGLQQAYQQATQQYNVDQAQRMQAALANQAATQDVARQNLQAAMGIQQLGAGQSLEEQRLNQAAAMNVAQQNLAAEQARQQFMGQTGLQAALANQTSQQRLGETNLQALINQYQFGAGQGLQAQQLNQAAQLQAQQQALAQLAQANQFSQQNALQRAQFGLQGANLAEQSRQFGAGLGLQGLQQQLAAAGMLGNLGQQQYQQQMGINAAQLGAGGQQQALQQELLNTQYQDFLNAQRFPYQQAEFMSGILRGLPATGQTQQFYQQPGSLFGQIAGVGLGLGSLFGGFGQTTGGK